jgi:Transcription factor e(y)2
VSNLFILINYLYNRLPRNNADTKRVVDQMTILKGERITLKNILIQLLHESGWTDRVRLMCREEITKANGLITVDNLVEKVTPKARQQISDEIKSEMVLRIKQILLQADSSED